MTGGLPPMTTLRAFCASPLPPPSQIIEGLLHQGCKLVLGGASKSNKSWCLLDLALAVCTGGKWWGRRCAKKPVVYLNFELQPWAIHERLTVLSQEHQVRPEDAETLVLWNLRGCDGDVARLRPMLEAGIRRVRPGLVVVDPVYKLLGDRDENNNGAIAAVLREFERLAQGSGAAVAVAHHFAKGDAMSKDAIDRMSGAGVWARDPDTLLIMTPTKDAENYEVTPILRNLPRLDPFVLRWEFPRMVQVIGGRCSEQAEELYEEIGETPMGVTTLVSQVAGRGLTGRDVDRLLAELVLLGKVVRTTSSVWRNSGKWGQT